jgi:hypothetical protein
MSGRDDDRPPTADRLRDEIDHGAAGDKVPFPDPAAAPLGTDDEAAGTPPTRGQVAAAMGDEATRAPAVPTAERPEDVQRDTGYRRGMAAILVVLALLILIAILALV